ncbi:MAG: ribonuclease D, partial [Acidobacteriota bacterium]|nr:ribonuclease D [Acidobacteriota bacterium]
MGVTPSVPWIEQTTGLVAAVREVGAGPLALDTEADSYHRYHDKVCLVQLSFGGRDVLVDPLAGVDLAVLSEVLENRRIPKILHGADYDLRILGRDFGLSFRGVFDTMIAARLVGERAFGLASLVERHLGVRLDKTHQLADWSQRPLPDELVLYAVSDTRFLPPLAERLEARLEELGRVSWAAEEFRHLEKVRWSGEPPDGEAFRRIKRSASLDRRGLAIVRELYHWRDGRARARDV